MLLERAIEKGHMSAALSATTSIAVLSAPIKDLYESGKHAYKEQLSKWNNSKTIKSLATKVAAYEQVKTIWQREKKVKLSSFYYPSKVTFDTGVTKPVLSLKDIPTTGGLVIQGTVGQGKSIFLRYLCIRELSNQSSGRIPIFIELRKLDTNFNLESALFSTLESLGFEISQELFKYYAESGKIVILLDGFDEIDETLVRDVVTKLELWAIRYPRMQFIITSRPGGEIQKSNHFSVICLAPLSPNEHKLFMKTIGVKGETLDHLLTAIEASPMEIQGLLTTPLLLTLLVLVYQSEGKIPSELPDFFKLLFATVFSRHDRSKPAFDRKHKSGLNERKLEQLFEAFCYAVMRRKFLVNLKSDQLEAAFLDAQRFVTEKCDCDIDGFRHDIIKVACLLQEDGQYTTFVHKSLLDFFSAAFIKSCTDGQSERIYQSIRPHWTAWRHALQFLSYIDKYRFARNFAIPEIEALLAKYGIQNGTITDKNVTLFINDTLTEETNFYFILDKRTHKYATNRFGNFNSLSTYFSDNEVLRILPSSHIDQVDKIEVPFKICQSDDVEEKGALLVHWKDGINVEEFNRFKLAVSDLLIRLQGRLNEYKKLVADEGRRADLLAALDIMD